MSSLTQKEKTRKKGWPGANPLQNTYKTTTTRFTTIQKPNRARSPRKFWSSKKSSCMSVGPQKSIEPKPKELIHSPLSSYRSKADVIPVEMYPRYQQVTYQTLFSKLMYPAKIPASHIPSSFFLFCQPTYIPWHDLQSSLWKWRWSSLGRKKNAALSSSSCSIAMILLITSSSLPLYPIFTSLFTCYTACDSFKRILFPLEIPSVETERATAAALNTTLLVFFFLPPRFLAGGDGMG